MLNPLGLDLAIIAKSSRVSRSRAISRVLQRARVSVVSSFRDTVVESGKIASFRKPNTGLIVPAIGGQNVLNLVEWISLVSSKIPVQTTVTPESIGIGVYACLGGKVASNSRLSAMLFENESPDVVGIGVAERGGLDFREKGDTDLELTVNGVKAGFETVVDKTSFSCNKESA
nr:hypothetical protein CR513_28803 [Ipomoea batatas]